ncbi:MAG: hypothetical protein AUK44_09435 [Porphyromonadaceae bacterium CG2_30_38_12]|nr:MAG: hypothetical protein AUK44_09435 [Porphyromonadaceae bacterium CG2_30_38_12]
MKKIVVACVLVVGLITTASAQQTIGVRGLLNNNGEISYQTSVGKANRLEFDLGLTNLSANSGIQLTGVYQWMFPLDQLAPGFDWYAGIGATAGSYQKNTGFGVVGQIGLEYNFTIPIQISIDWRPTIFNTYYTNYAGSGLSVRYRF